MRVLQELGQASLGVNGIAIDTRNIAEIMTGLDAVEWTGLLTQHDGAGARRLATHGHDRAGEDKLTGALFMNAIATGGADQGGLWSKRILGFPLTYVRRWLDTWRSRYGTAALPNLYSDMVWRRYFAPSMPARARATFATAPFRWTNLTHSVLLDRYRMPLASAFGPCRLDTRGYDVYLTPEPKPVRVSPKTRVLHRYHDAIPFTASDTQAQSEATVFHYHFVQQAIALGGEFVCNSEPSRTELLSVWPTIRPERTHTIPCAVHASLSAEARTLNPADIVAARLSDLLLDDNPYRLDMLRRLQESARGMQRYILAVAALEPKKNIVRTVRAFERLKARRPDLKLVVVGNNGWMAQDIIEAMRPHYLAGDLLHVARLPYVELQALMHRAACLVFPSIAEGFGLPPVEALACETPSVVASIPALEWVMGRNAVFVDPYDPGAIADGVERAMSEQGRADVLSGAQTTLDRFAPSTVAEQWAALLASTPRKGAQAGQSAGAAAAAPAPQNAMAARAAAP